MSVSPQVVQPTPTMFGHPPGLFGLFFVEMWERFSFYGMRALLTYYLVQGFMGLGDSQAYGVYAAYGALVYATPFIGGLLADRLLGARRAVIMGGLLMAIGHFLMMFESEMGLFGGLAFLVAGNGLFKPNISTIVGGLYPDKAVVKRDSGFTIFYMGINLGAGISPLLCAYFSQEHGFHAGFGIATAGMLVGLGLFIVRDRVSRFLILFSAVGTVTSLIAYSPNNPFLMGTNIALGATLLFAGVVAFRALGKAGLPEELGRVPSLRRLRQPAVPALKQHVIPLYLGVIAFVLMVQQVLPHGSVWSYLVFAAGITVLAIPWVSANVAFYLGLASSIVMFALLVQNSAAAKVVLIVLGIVAFGSLLIEAFRMPTIARHRLIVALVLMFFSMLFWGLFEQAGTSMSLFTERNVDRVAETRFVEATEVGRSLTIEATQEQLGYTFAGKPFFMQDLVELQQAAQKEGKAPQMTFIVESGHVGMGLGSMDTEIPPAAFQSANPIFILIFGMLFAALWSFLAKRKLEPSVPIKFALGLVQLGLGFVALWMGAEQADERGMVGVFWLLAGYLLHTTGELCLSPVGLSMVTKLAPRRMVSTIMGAWFLATAFSYLITDFVAKLTDANAGTKGPIPAPIETVAIYGEVYLKVAISVGIFAAVLFALSPLLSKWTHPEEPEDVDSTPIHRGEDEEAAA